jgi:hypothetical protein
VTFKSFCDTWKVKPAGRGLVRRYFTLVDNERSEFGEDSLYFQVHVKRLAYQVIMKLDSHKNFTS